MKKVTFILALGVALTLAACGSGSTATQTTDSTAAPLVDSTSVPVEGGAGGGVQDENGKGDSHSTVEEVK